MNLSQTHIIIVAIGCTFTFLHEIMRIIIERRFKKNPRMMRVLTRKEQLDDIIPEPIHLILFFLSILSIVELNLDSDYYLIIYASLTGGVNGSLSLSKIMLFFLCYLNKLIIKIIK